MYKRQVIWKSLTPDKATVNEKGEVKGVAEGTARIQVTATDDKPVSYTHLDVYKRQELD